MGQAFKDSEFFERWNHHRTRYFTKLALIIIVPAVVSIVLYPLSLLSFSLFPVFILASGVLAILAALYIIITNPPIE